MPESPHRSHHESVDDLPLLTESAEVTEVAAMDHNRNDQVLPAIRTVLDEHGTSNWTSERPGDDESCESWLGDQLDPVDHVEGGAPLDKYLPEKRRSGRPGDILRALQARYLQPYPSLIRFTVETDDPLDFLPGQYLSLTYEDTTRAYSVASSPTRGDVEFCVRRVSGGEMTSELAVSLDEGDTVSLRGPYGDLLLESPSSRDVVFLATGTGVAPFKSMLDYMFESEWDRFEGAPRDVWLFLGSGWRDHLPYHDDFHSMAERHDNFHYVPTLSRESYLTDWDGETAYVQYALAKCLDDDAVERSQLPAEFQSFMDDAPASGIEARIDPSNAEVYACGVTAMVNSLVDAVERLGVPADHVQSEGFG